jgi:hypothetical protein
LEKEKESCLVFYVMSVLHSLQIVPRGLSYALLFI